jgi:hypothetical protein
MVPFVAITLTGVLNSDVPGGLFGVVQAEQSAPSKGVLRRQTIGGVGGRERDFRFDAFALFVEKDHVFKIHRRRPGLKQLSAPLIERQARADRQGARRWLFTGLLGWDRVSVDHAPTVNRAVEQPSPFDQVGLLYAK